MPPFVNSAAASDGCPADGASAARAPVRAFSSHRLGQCLALSGSGLQRLGLEQIANGAVQHRAHLVQVV